jgi:hypothetical protein
MGEASSGMASRYGRAGAKGYNVTTKSAPKSTLRGSPFKTARTKVVKANRKALKMK